MLPKILSKDSSIANTGCMKIIINLAEIFNASPHAFFNSQRKWEQHYPLTMLNLISVFILEIRKEEFQPFSKDFDLI